MPLLALSSKHCWDSVWPQSYYFCNRCVPTCGKPSVQTLAEDEEHQIPPLVRKLSEEMAPFILIMLVNMSIHVGTTKHQTCYALCYLLVYLLNIIMWKDLDKCNTVRFIDSFTMSNNSPALAFKVLDVTLKDYLFQQWSFTPLD